MINPNIDIKGKNKFTPAGVGVVSFGAFAEAYVAGAAATAADPAAAAAAAQADLGAGCGQGGICGNPIAENIANDASAQAGAFAASVDANANATDVAPNALVPGVYVAIPVSEDLAFGFSANSYFGLATDFGKNYSASEHAGETAIETYYITPSVAYKITDSISIGLGLQYIYGKGLIDNYASSTLAIVPEGQTLVNLDGDGDAFGFQLGVIWEINDSSSIGFRYQSEVDLDFDGDIELYSSALQGTAKGDGILTANLPAMAEIGYSNQLTEQWTLHGTILYTGWSSFENLTANIDKGGDFPASQDRLLKEENWDDAYSFAIGADYAINEITTLRAGISYDESPVDDEFRTLTIPDSDRMWYSLGATIMVGGAGSIDASLLFIDGKSAKINEEFKSELPVLGEVAISEFSGELDAGATIFSLGYNHKF
jgi:long-chain fatty acid transport protein